MSGATQDAKGNRRDYLGRAVDPVTREVRFLSVSAMERADASTHQGCERKWYYNYVLQKKEPETKSTKRGNELHEVTAHYLRTGVRVLPAQVMRGLHMIEPPGPDLFVEQPLLGLDPATGLPDLARARLRLLGSIPLIGAIDMMHERGTNRGAPDIMDTYDPPGTVEVVDWKFPRNLEHIKKPHELARTIQMSGYAKFVFDAAPLVQQIRLSHGIMPVEDHPFKSTIRVDREAVRAGWEHAEAVARSIVHAARETDPDKVPANTRACRAFKKKCIHMDYCRAGMHNSLASVIGTTAADRLFANEPQGQEGQASLRERVSYIGQVPGPAQPVAQAPWWYSSNAQSARLQQDVQAGASGGTSASLARERSTLASIQPREGLVQQDGLQDESVRSDRVRLVGDVIQPERLLRYLPGRVHGAVSSLYGPQPSDNAGQRAAVSEMQCSSGNGRGVSDRSTGSNQLFTETPKVDMTTPGAPSPFGFPGFPQQPGQPPAQQGSALSGVFQNQPPQQIPQAQPFPPGIMIPQGQPQVQINPMQLAQMQAEEAAQRAAQAQLQAGQAPGSVAPPAGILDICGKISAIGKGFPRLEGQAAQAVAMAAGASVPPDHVYPGQGEIQGVVISDPNMLPQLLTQLQDLASRQAPTPPAQLPPQAGGILPGDAPPSNPMLASSGPPVQPQQTVAQGGPLASMTAEPAPKKRKSKADKETEAAAAALAAQQVAMQNQAPGLSAFAPQQQAQTFTTVIGSQGVPHQVQQVQYAPQPRQMQDQPQFMVNADTGVHLYVDVTHLSGNGYERFEPIAAALNKGLAMEAGAKDVRCAPSEGPLGFGRWKGVILPAIRDKFLAQIPPGRYLYDARGNEFHEEVATAMREICMERGWTWMRGLG